MRKAGPESAATEPRARRRRGGPPGLVRRRAVCDRAWRPEVLLAGRAPHVPCPGQRPSSCTSSTRLSSSSPRLSGSNCPGFRPCSPAWLPDRGCAGFPERWCAGASRPLPGSRERTASGRPPDRVEDYAAARASQTLAACRYSTQMAAGSGLFVRDPAHLWRNGADPVCCRTGCRSASAERTPFRQRATGAGIPGATASATGWSTESRHHAPTAARRPPP